MKRVAVLGCGPAGLLVAHAATLQGHRVEIFSEPEKSFISGAQYLHSPIPELTGEHPQGLLFYVRHGTAEGYAEKIYGDPNAETSWTAFGETAPAWNLRRYYGRLWERYSGKVVPVRVDREMMLRMARTVDAVFSTIPLRALAAGLYKHEDVWIGQSYANIPENTIVYDGDLNFKHYRKSNIFGHKSIEYPGRLAHRDLPPWPELKRIRKPVSAQLTEMMPLNFWPFGRYGQWKKGVLLDHAFQQAYKVAGDL